MAEEKCFVDYEKALTEDLKEHIKENCSKLEKCFDDIKKQKSLFNAYKAALVEYDEYIELLTVVRPPPEDFIYPSKFSFMESLSGEPRTLDDVYNLSHYYYGASDGTVTNVPGYRADPEIQKALDSGQYNKEYPTTIHTSAKWLRETITMAKGDPETYFSGEAQTDYGPEQEQKLDELTDVLRKIDIVVGVEGAGPNVSRNCAKDFRIL